MKLLLKASYGPFCFHKEILEKLDIPYHTVMPTPFDEYSIPNKPISKTKMNKIIDWVERFGSEYVTNPKYCYFEVVDIPKGTFYRIREYDSYEYVEFRDEIDWKIAE